MIETAIPSVAFYDDVLSKDFFHMSYLRRKAIAEEPQRLARVSDVIGHIKSLLEEIDSETFEDLIGAISLLGSKASSYFIHQYEHDVCIEYRHRLCSTIFTRELAASLNSIHELSKDYVYDAMSLTNATPMDSYLEAIDDYWQLLDENLHLPPEKACSVEMLSIYPRVARLFPHKGYQISMSNNEVTMTATPSHPEYTFENMLESLLKRIFLLRDNDECASSEEISKIEELCREWLQKRVNAIWIDKKGLRGRLLGLWMWDYKHNGEKKTIRAAKDACYQYCYDTFGQELSYNALREYYDGTRNCIKHGEIRPLSRT
jgi:hypothetical protein